MLATSVIQELNAEEWNTAIAVSLNGGDGVFDARTVPPDRARGPVTFELDHVSIPAGTFLLKSRRQRVELVEYVALMDRMRGDDRSARRSWIDVLAPQFELTSEGAEDRSLQGFLSGHLRCNLFDDFQDVALGQGADSSPRDILTSDVDNMRTPHKSNCPWTPP